MAAIEFVSWLMWLCSFFVHDSQCMERAAYREAAYVAVRILD